jgi:hypothetical protein
MGCGTSSALAPAELPTLAAADEARARALAPDLYARARAVRELALDTAERGVAEEHAARARLLFEAAVLEADRLELERRQEALLREAGGDEQARVTALEALRVTERERRLAALEARGEATAALSARERQLLRARALLGAAHALHAPAEALQTAENALLGAELDGAASAKAVARALAAAEQALAAARARGPAPAAP